MKDSKLIIDFKKAVLTLKAYSEDNPEYRRLIKNLERLHNRIFCADRINLDQHDALEKWLRSIDFEY